MGLFDRFRRLIKSNINDMISKAENPEKMLNQLISDMNQQLIDSKKSVASAIADEKKLKRRIDETRAQADEWERKAVLALKSEREDLARQALQQKQQYENLAAEYEQQWKAQCDAVERLKLSLRGLDQKIDEAQRKRNMLIARAKRAEAQRKMQETLGGLSDTSAFEAFDKMSAKMDQIEAENEALEEIEGKIQDDSLEREFAKLESSSGESDTLLDALREKIALEDKSGPSASDAAGGSDVAQDDAPQDIDESLEALKQKLKNESSGDT
ncbi:MAG: PspA/IM30 family protein [Spirochaetaceae bacterium]|nr:MAG: PspA/IM30 family protein [Spirochaetaceae bacterium]